MPGTFKEWTVLPHGKLTKMDDDLLTVVGDLPMPMGEFPRRMTVVRLRDGRLVVFSAIALDEPEMRVIEDWGRLSFMIVPNERHRKDARIWKDRYPDLRVIAPEGARAEVAEVVSVDATSGDFGDPDVEFVTVPGTDRGEAALVVRRPAGTTLVLNEIIWNVENHPGVGGFLFRLAGFTGHEPKIPTFVAMKSITDKPALKAQLEAWAGIAGLQRILVSHGGVIDADPVGVLRGLAAALSS
jgi:hypothetical protein